MFLLHPFLISARRRPAFRTFVAIALFSPALQIAGAAVDYEKDIKALFQERCISCHGSVKQKGGLRLDAGALMVKGGKHPVIVTGDSQRSALLERLLTDDEDERMPPEGKRLTTGQIEQVRQWIDGGAVYPQDEAIPKAPSEHWSFQPVRSPAVPDIQRQGLGHEPRRCLRLGEVGTAGLARHRHPQTRWPYCAASTWTLPACLLTLAEQERFARQPQLELVIDNLLGRPEYGERWARHWLDVVRYADSNGYERDAEKPFVWRYRDYVIDSLNHDKPFDRFVLEQIAGDELPDRSIETRIGTGFLRLGHWDDEPADPMTDRYDQLDDIVSTTGQAFLGLTIGCARCHDHKFEPLATRDYYSLVAVFNPLERPRKGRTELTVPVDGTEVYSLA